MVLFVQTDMPSIIKGKESESVDLRLPHTLPYDGRRYELKQEDQGSPIPTWTNYAAMHIVFASHI